MLNKTLVQYPELEIVSGMAKGPDMFGYEWAVLNGVPVHKFPANWNKYGKRAGFLRNEQMAQFGDSAIGFWDGESKGTKMMINLMNEAEKPVVVVRQGE